MAACQNGPSFHARNADDTVVLVAVDDSEVLIVDELSLKSLMIRFPQIVINACTILSRHLQTVAAATSAKQ